MHRDELRPVILNPPGRDMVGLFHTRGELTLEEVVVSLTEIYAVDADRARADAELMLTDLLTERILELA